MPMFDFAAVDALGRQASGTQDADTPASASQALLQQDPDVPEPTPRKRWTQLELTPTRISSPELMHISRQLATFLRAGIPILDAIATLGEESDRTAVRRVLAQLGRDLRAGSTLSEAVDRHPKDFPAYFRSILHSAELTGRLDGVLDQLASYLERDLEARRKIKAALIYPAIVALMAIITVVVLSIFVLPKFETFFASLDAKLPLATRLLLVGTRFVGTWWWLIIGVGTVTVLAALITVQTGPGRLLWHRTLLRTPVIGQTVRYALVERFTRILASMVGAGVPLPTAIAVATQSLRNAVFERALTTARESLIQGAGLAQPISRTKLFPGMAAQMIRVGEETGTLEAQLEVAAAFYERELDYKVKKLTTTIEPAVIVIMGAVVGFVAIALVSAMYGIFRTAHLS